MSRQRTIRTDRTPIRTDAESQGAAVVFWLVFVLAICVGGTRALSDFPALIGLLVPQGIMAAEAEADPAAGHVTFSIQVLASSSFYKSQLLAAGQGHPKWLLRRIALARDTHAAGPGAIASGDAPAIAIIIDDLGADEINTRRAIALPKEISLSFLPYPDAAPELAREGLRQGHQIIVHVPMEPLGKADPGPMALLTSSSTATNLGRLDWALDRIKGYSGINNHEGSRFTADRASLMPVIEHLEQRHIFFLDSRTAPDTDVVPLSRAFGVASAGRDVFLDDVQTVNAINAELARTEALAREQGTVIVIGHPHAMTMDVLSRWSANAEARGFELVTASEAIRRKTERDALKGKIDVSLSASR